jgi:hypothetical protein
MGKAKKKGGLKVKGLKTPGSKKKTARDGSRMVTAYDFAKPAMSTRVPKPVNSTLSLSDCVTKFALAVADPFSSGARGACIPVMDGATAKVTAVSRFEMALGTTGEGWVFLSPCTVSDLPCAYATTAAWNGSSRDIYSSVGSASTAAVLATGWQQIFHNSPYSWLDFTKAQSETMSAKVVSVGLRAQYVGTTMDESGINYCYQEPSHNSLSGMDVTNFSNLDADVSPCTREPCTLTCYPVSNDELTFYNGLNQNDENTRSTYNILYQTYPFSRGSAGFRGIYNSTQTATFYANNFSGTYANNPYVGTPVGAFCVSGGKAGSRIHIELVHHLEFRGGGATALQTETPSDVEGSNMVICAAQRLPRLQLANPGRARWELLRAALSSIWKAARPHAVPVARAALEALVL